MRSHLVLPTLFAALCFSSVTHAQTARPMPRDYPGVAVVVPGIFLTPVANAPFSGDVEILSHEKLPDGSEHTVTARNHLARSSSGRIYQERHPMAAVDLLGKTQVLSAHIYDPNTRQSIMLFPARRLARALTLRRPEIMPASALPPAQQVAQPGVTQVDLGVHSMDGLELHGIRKEHTVPATLSGTGKPVVVTDEYWYSDALSIYMIIRHIDPRTGEQLVAVHHVERAEPPAEQFAVPPDYKIVDETTEQAPVARY